jgi:hypothetical protein
MEKSPNKKPSNVAVYLLFLLGVLGIASLLGGAYMMANPRTITVSYAVTQFNTVTSVTTQTSSYSTTSTTTSTSTLSAYNFGYGNYNGGYGAGCYNNQYCNQPYQSCYSQSVYGQVVCTGYIYPSSTCTYLEVTNTYGQGSYNTIPLYNIPSWFPTGTWTQSSIVTVTGTWTSTGACGQGINVTQIN